MTFDNDSLDLPVEYLHREIYQNIHHYMRSQFHHVFHVSLWTLQASLYPRLYSAHRHQENVTMGRTYRKPQKYKPHYQMQSQRDHRLNYFKFRWLQEILKEYEWQYFFTLHLKPGTRMHNCHSLVRKLCYHIKYGKQTRPYASNSTIFYLITVKNYLGYTVPHVHILFSDLKIASRASETRFSRLLEDSTGHDSDVSTMYDIGGLNRYVSAHQLGTLHNRQVEYDFLETTSPDPPIGSLADDQRRNPAR